MSTLLIILGGALLVIMFTRRPLFSAHEIRYARIAFVLHIASAFAQAYLQDEFYGGTSDDNGYLRTGTLIARLLVSDFTRFAPEIVRMAFHFDSSVPISIYGTSGSQTMAAIAGFHVYAFGPALVNGCLVVGIFSWFGQLCLYHVARSVFAESERTSVLIGCLLVPSAVFWGSAFEKEALVLGASGILTWALLRLPKILSVVAGICAAVLIGLVKPYVLFPYVFGVNAWLYVSWSARRTRRVQVRPRYVILALLGASVALVVLGSIFPQFGMKQLSDTVAYEQNAWQGAVGGSNFGIEPASAGLSNQLSFIPFAITNALFRPAIFEVRNVTMLAATLETTAVTVASASLMIRYRWRRLAETVLVSPPLAFAVTFIFILSVAVGLTTRNLGTLTRYRVPMMPFLVTALLVMHQRARQSITATIIGGTS